MPVESTKVAYFNCVEIEEKVVLSLAPIPLTAIMIASATPEAIRSYSMAVADLDCCKAHSASEMGQSRPGQVSSKSGHVGYAPKAEVNSEHWHLPRWAVAG